MRDQIGFGRSQAANNVDPEAIAVDFSDEQVENIANFQAYGFLPELVARCRALGRRATPAAPPMLTADDVVLDPARRTVSRAGRSLDLTRKEFGVLEVLLAARGAVVSSEELLERVWDANTDPFTTTVRVTVMTLRKKVGDPPLIETVVGAGYRVPEPVTVTHGGTA